MQLIECAVKEGDPLRFKLILMDCNMPFMDGYKATKKIRNIYEGLGIERAHQPYIVALTGHTEKEYVQKALNSGMDKVYSKPLNCRDFARLLLQRNAIASIPQSLLTITK